MNGVHSPMHHRHQPVASQPIGLGVDMVTTNDVSTVAQTVHDAGSLKTRVTGLTDFNTGGDETVILHFSTTATLGLKGRIRISDRPK